MKAPSPRTPAPSAPPARRPAPPRTRVPDAASPRKRPRRGEVSEDPAPLPNGVQHDHASDAPPGYSHLVNVPAAQQAPAAPLVPAAVNPPLAPAFDIETLRAMVDTSGKLPLETASDDSGGSFFVRMISPSNLIRAIPVGAVTNRLCNGWRFIEHEPVLPRASCPVEKHNTCDLEGTAGFYPRGRPLADQPKTHLDGVRVWLQEFVADQARYAGRKDLDHGYGRRLVSQFKTNT